VSAASGPLGQALQVGPSSGRRREFVGVPVQRGSVGGPTPGEDRADLGAPALHPWDMLVTPRSHWPGGYRAHTLFRSWLMPPSAAPAAGVASYCSTADDGASAQRAVRSCRGPSSLQGHRRRAEIRLWAPPCSVKPRPGSRSPAPLQLQVNGVQRLPRRMGRPPPADRSDQRSAQLPSAPACSPSPTSVTTLCRNTDRTPPRTASATSQLSRTPGATPAHAAAMWPRVPPVLWRSATSWHSGPPRSAPVVEALPRAPL